MDIKQIRNRIKSVDSTLHITKAMKLVASSKIKRAEDNFRSLSFYSDSVGETMRGLLSGECKDSPFVTPANAAAPVCYIMIEADRGLAGGYNSQINKLFEAQEGEKTVIPIGKRACDYCSRRGIEAPLSFSSSEHIDNDGITAVADFISEAMENGEISGVKILYTKYRNALVQQAEVKELLPLKADAASPSLTEYEPSREAVLDYAVPMYLSTTVRSAVRESFLCEQYARRNAMDSATENATDMIDSLSLQYNRARQNSITQEITEIVAGANANAN